MILLNQILVALLASSIVTLIILMWELIENPSDIFYNENGINWAFIFDTTVSWFVPIIIYVTVVGSVFYLLVFAITWLYKRHFNK